MAKLTPAEGLERFLFTPVDGQVVRQFRIVLALMLAWTFWPREGGLARELLDKPLLPALYEQVFLTPVYHLWIGVLLIFLALGRYTRGVGFLLLLFLLPLDFLTIGQQSRQVMLFTLLAFLCFPTDTTQPMPIWPIRLMQIQLTLVYGINALVKTTPHFLSGEAFVGMAQNLPNFKIEFVNGAWQLGFLALPVSLLAIATVVTEYSLALGFWFKRMRVATALLGVGFHVALKFIIKIGMLDWVSMFLYLTFLMPFAQKKAGVSLQGTKTPDVD